MKNDEELRCSVKCREGEVVGSIPGRDIPKFKNDTSGYLGAQHYNKNKTEIL